jgi:N-dimethylarginine dimethylaminohydrolase
MYPDISKPISPSAFDEYGPLKTALMCEPIFLTNSQKNSKLINGEKAVQQHREFTKALTDLGVEVILLSPDPHHPERVFTRDIGFVVGATLYITEMTKVGRLHEEAFLENWLKRNGVNYTNLSQDQIEAGDVLIDQDIVYVGLSDRTTKQSTRHLMHLLPVRSVMAVPFSDQFLHLDCVFNIISPNEAIIYPGEISKKEHEFLSSRYALIHVTKEEAERLGPNVFSIGNKKLFSIPENKKMNEELRRRGYDVIELDFSEMIKAGGSFRCSTLPLVREKFHK